MIVCKSEDETGNVGDYTLSLVWWFFGLVFLTYYRIST